MTEVNTAEAFRAAADEARKSLMVGSDVAPSPEPVSSTETGAESIVPEVKVETPEASKNEATPEAKPGIDPEAAWNEYKTDEERKKALAHNKAYAAEMSRKARELETQLAERDKKVDKVEVEAKPEVEAPEKDYDTWIAESLQKPDTKEKSSIASLASEYNRYLEETLAPAETALKETAEKVRVAEDSLKESEAALKFLQSRKDPSLYETDIAEAKEKLQDARFVLSEARRAEDRAQTSHQKAEVNVAAKLGVLRREARETYDNEIKARRDSASAKKAEEESRSFQNTVNKSWEEAKIKVIEARGNLSQEAKKFLMDAADGAIVRAAAENKIIQIADYGKFIDEAIKPFQSTTEQARQDAVKSVISITDEPTPAKATSDNKNVDAQPMNYNEWRAKARKVLRAS